MNKLEPQGIYIWFQYPSKIIIFLIKSVFFLQAFFIFNQ